MTAEKPFYVYVHKYASGPKTGKVFYVGKGSGGRSNRPHGRNQYWERTYRKYGFTAHVIMRFESEACAFSFERALIKHYGRENLCNLTDGGEGLSGCNEETRDKLRAYHVGSKSYRFDHSIYEFQNIDGRVFIGTRYDLRSFGIPDCQITNMVAGRLQHCHGWFLKGKPPKEKNYMRGSNHYALDKREMRFVHKDGTEFIGIRFDFSQKYGIPNKSVGQLARGEIKTSFGWSCYEI